MATKKSAVKKSAERKAALKVQGKSSVAGGAAAPQASVKKQAAKESVAKSAAKSVAKGKSAAKKSAAKKNSAKGKSVENYTDPALRERIKAEVLAGDKGGHPGQWSARKAQMVAHEYVAEGGGYTQPRNDAQESLKEWGDEHWHTADDKPAIRDDGKGGEETHRYLPDEAWKELSPDEKKATDAKKVRGSREGKQFVANTEKAKEARKHVTK